MGLFSFEILWILKPKHKLKANKLSEMNRHECQLYSKVSFPLLINCSHLLLIYYLSIPVWPWNLVVQKCFSIIIKHRHRNAAQVTEALVGLQIKGVIKANYFPINLDVCL